MLNEINLVQIMANELLHLRSIQYIGLSCNTIKYPIYLEKVKNMQPIFNLSRSSKLLITLHRTCQSSLKLKENNNHISIV